MVKAERDLSNNLQHISSDRATFISEEHVRIVNVNTTIWPLLKKLWALLLVASLAVVMFTSHERALGIALGLLLAAVVFMVVDTLAEKRTLIYGQQLEMAKKAISEAGTQ